MIRTLQDKGIHSGIDVYMECTITHIIKDAVTKLPVRSAIGEKAVNLYYLKLKLSFLQQVEWEKHTR